MRRLGIAFLLALVLHALFAAFARPFGRHGQRLVQSQPLVYVRLVPSVHRHPPPKRLRRTPPRIVRRLPPKIVEHARSRSNAGARARDIRRAHRAAHGAPALAVRREVARPTAAPAPPQASRVAAAALPGTGTLAGTSGTTGGRSGGAGGDAGAGQGTSTSGSGTGDGLAPCGEVLIRRHGPIKTYDGQEHVNVLIQVQLKDGTLSPELPLPYPLVYKSDTESPFSERNRSNPNFPVLLQFPPPDQDVASFPLLISLVLKHTGPDGYTLFDACPSNMPIEGPP